MQVNPPTNKPRNLYTRPSRTQDWRDKKKLADEKDNANQICDACGLLLNYIETKGGSDGGTKIYRHRNTERAVSIAGVHFITIREEEDSNEEK